MTRPVIRTERLLLEPLTVDHTDLLVELDSDPEVLRFIFGRALTRSEVIETWMPKRTRADADSRGIGFWVGWAANAFVGWWCLSVDDSDPSAAELGYRLPQQAWGHGYATEGGRALVEHGFGGVGLQLIWGETMAVNHASRRVLSKCGLRHVSTEVRRWPDPLPGWDQGEVRYELTREEWAVATWR